MRFDTQRHAFMAIFTLVILGGAFYIGSSVKEEREIKSRLSKFEIKAWDETACERCGKIIGTSNPKDGVYMVVDKAMVLHGACAELINKEHPKKEKKHHGSYR